MFCDTWRRKSKTRTDSNASSRYFSMSVSLKKHVCVFMYLSSPWIFLSLVATRACIPKSHPQDKTAESLLITLTITQQLRRDLGPLPPLFFPFSYEEIKPCQCWFTSPSSQAGHSKAIHFHQGSSLIML